MSYIARFQNEDGSTDTLPLGAIASDGEAVQKARSALFASLSARSVDVFTDQQRVAHIRRDIPRFPAPSDPRRFARRFAAG